MNLIIIKMILLLSFMIFHDYYYYGSSIIPINTVVVAFQCISRSSSITTTTTVNDSSNNSIGTITRNNIRSISLLRPVVQQQQQQQLAVRVSNIRSSSTVLQLMSSLSSSGEDISSFLVSLNDLITTSTLTSNTITNMFQEYNHHNHQMIVLYNIRDYINEFYLSCPYISAFITCSCKGGFADYIVQYQKNQKQNNQQHIKQQQHGQQQQQQDQSSTGTSCSHHDNTININRNIGFIVYGGFYQGLFQQYMYSNIFPKYFEISSNNNDETGRIVIISIVLQLMIDMILLGPLLCLPISYIVQSLCTTSSSSAAAKSVGNTLSIKEIMNRNPFQQQPILSMSTISSSLSISSMSSFIPSYSKITSSMPGKVVPERRGSHKNHVGCSSTPSIYKHSEPHLWFRWMIHNNDDNTEYNNYNIFQNNKNYDNYYDYYANTYYYSDSIITFNTIINQISYIFESIIEFFYIIIHKINNGIQLYINDINFWNNNNDNNHDSNNPKQHSILLQYWSLWIPIKLITFTIIPHHLRIVFIAFISFFWMMILSSNTTTTAAITTPIDTNTITTTIDTNTITTTIDTNIISNITITGIGTIIDISMTTTNDVTRKTASGSLKTNSQTTSIQK